ncbi:MULTISPECIES: hypothetical protein [unclassified Methylobacterium]|uniref:hypothetical protein n=1 Tax=unclassified Methylobacterium TaxID=2615210 RepID=UPI0036FA4850
MTPEKFKNDVQIAYKKAISKTNSWTHHDDHTHRIFDGVTVFGREAGIDLVQTVIGSILQEAVHAAEAKKRSMTLRPGRIGKAALAGMVETLRAMTGLPVSEGNGVITIAWAKDEPDLY